MDHVPHYGPFCDSKEFPGSSVKDLTMDSFKKRPRRASRTVKPLTGRGSGRGRAYQEYNITLSFRFLDFRIIVTSGKLRFSYQIIKVIVDLLIIFWSTTDCGSSNGLWVFSMVQQLAKFLVFSSTIATYVS
uniref:Uncharacterized protein n=1 Tax=Solanum tuberosum TaxID=4113 RepID=M1D879_SOLTU